MLQTITIEEYLQRTKPLPLIDVRSPGEYEKGHIPGATNIPLFSNDERAHVGTVYVRQSKDAAIELGYKYVTPKLEWFITEALRTAPRKEVAVHCWRGGMRSQSFARHLHENGFQRVFVITGGYKAFRNYILDSFAREAQLLILGGYTGSGKTHILYELQKKGEQIIDLEGLAHHKGSAFGKMGDGWQPTIEQFENNLFWKWKALDLNQPIWIEDESHRIGNINIPMPLFEQMRRKHVFFIEIPREERARELVLDYGQQDRAMLAEAIQRISKRLGGLSTTLALKALEEGNYYEVAMITLHYYDKYYLRGLKKRAPETITKINFEKIDFEKIADALITQARQAATTPPIN